MFYPFTAARAGLYDGYGGGISASHVYLMIIPVIRNSFNRIPYQNVEYFTKFLQMFCGTGDLRICSFLLDGGGLRKVRGAGGACLFVEKG